MPKSSPKKGRAGGAGSSMSIHAAWLKSEVSLDTRSNSIRKPQGVVIEEQASAGSLSEALGAPADARGIRLIRAW